MHAGQLRWSYFYQFEFKIFLQLFKLVDFVYRFEAARLSFANHFLIVDFLLFRIFLFFSCALTYRDQHCNKVTARVLNKRQTYTNGDTHVICVYNVYFTNRMPLRYDCYIHASGCCCCCCCLTESSVSGCHSCRLFSCYLLASSAPTTTKLVVVVLFLSLFCLIREPKKEW